MRKFQDLTDEEIVKLALIANRNSINNPIDSSDWIIKRELSHDKIRTIIVKHKWSCSNELVFDMVWGGFSASVKVPGKHYHHSLIVPFHEFLDYLDSINIDYRN